MIDYTKYTLSYLEDKAFMIIVNIGFFFEKSNDESIIIAVNMEDPSKTLILDRINDTLRYSYDNMAKEDRYFTLYAVEKNKQMLLEGLSEWENT